MKFTSKYKLFLCGLLIFSMIGLLMMVSYQETVDTVNLNNSSPCALNSSDFSFNKLPHINATLFSDSNNNSNHLLLTGNPANSATKAEIAMELPSPPQYDQWYGRNTSITVYNLLDNRTWGNGNYDFSSGVDDGAPSIDQTDTTSYFHNDTITNWDPYYNEDNSAGHYNDMTVEYDATNDYVNLTYYGYRPNGIYQYNPNEYVGIRQTGIDIPRGVITNAWIKIIYNPVHFYNQSQSYFAFSTKINDIEVYHKTNYDLLGAGLINTGWLHLNAWSNSSNVFPTPSLNGYSNFNFSLSIENIFSNSFSLSAAVPEWLANYQRIQINSFQLAIEAAAKPNATDIQLEVNNRIFNGTFGYGAIEWGNNYPNFISTDPYSLIFNSSSSNSYIDLSFDVDVNFHVFKYASTTTTPNENDLGVTFMTDIPNNKIKYQFYLYNYWDFSTFINLYFNFSIPTDWNITLVRNPALKILYNKTSGYDLGLIGGNKGDGYIFLPSKNSTGGTFAELPGWWYFEAEGPNYISTIDVLKKEGSNWVPATSFNSSGPYDGDLLRIRATINNGTGIPPGVQSSAAYVKILLPNGTVLLTQENDSINVLTGEVTFGQFLLAGMNTTGGVFQAQVYWNNSHDYLTGYDKVVSPGSYYFGAGYSSKNFSVVHDSELKIINPVDAQSDLIADLNYFDIFPVKVLLNDTDGNTVISGSIVTLNWSGSVTLNEISEGLYSTNLDTTDLSGPGKYYLAIQSYKENFTNTTTSLTLNIIAESLLETIYSPSPEIFGSNFTLQLFYHLPGNSNYNYSSAIINVSTSPTSGYLIENVDYTYTDLLNGTYEINMFSGVSKTLNQTGEKKLYIHAYKPSIENATKEVTFYIDPIPTNVVTNQSIFSTRFFENTTLFVNYTVASDSFPIVGATINISGHGSLPYTVNELGGGLYSIELNSSSITNIYDIIITASRTNYLQKSVNFLLSVDAAESILENIIGIAPSTLSDNVSMLLFYYKPGTPTQNYTGALINASLNIDSNFLSESTDYRITSNPNGTYSLILYTGDGTSFNETGQHTIFIQASRSYVKNASTSVDIYLNAYATSFNSNQTLFTRQIYENVTLYVNYTKTDFSPILGAKINLSGYGGLIYSITEEGTGIYSIELNSSSTASTYNIIVTASKASYEQKSVNFILIVDNYDSVLENLEAVTPKSLSENISLSLFYHEPGNILQNYTGAILSVSLNSTSDYLIENVDYIYFNNLNGTYNLIFYTGDGTEFNETGQNSIYVHATRLNVKNASLKVDLYLEAYTSSLTSNQTLFSRQIYENATLYVNYTKTDFSPILGANINLSGHGGLNYNIVAKGLGIYSIEFNSSSTISTYNIIITASKLNYEQKSISIILIVDEFESILESITPVTPKILSENISLTLFYYAPGNAAQNYSGAGVSASLNLTSLFLVENVDYIYSDNLNGTYTLIFFSGDGTYFNTTGQHSIYIHASRLYVKNASRKVDLFLEAYQTVLTSNQTIFLTGMFENVTLFVNYTNSIDSLPIPGANIGIVGQESLAYTLNEIGNGLYSIELNTSGVSKSYNIIITASKVNYEQISVNFLLTVDAAESILEDIVGTIPVVLSENVTMRLFYYKPGDPMQNYTGATLTVSLNLTAIYLQNNVDFSYVDNLNGTYSFSLYTGAGTQFNETGQFIIYVHANRSYVKNASRKVDIFLNPYQTILSSNQTVFSSGMFENVTL